MIYNIIYDSAMTHPSRYSSIHDACHSKITNNNKYNDKQIICHLQITNHTKYNDKQIRAQSGARKAAMRKDMIAPAMVQAGRDCNQKQMND